MKNLNFVLEFRRKIGPHSATIIKVRDNKSIWFDNIIVVWWGRKCFTRFDDSSSFRSIFTQVVNMSYPRQIAIQFYTQIFNLNSSTLSIMLLLKVNLTLLNFSSVLLVPGITIFVLSTFKVSLFASNHFATLFRHEFSWFWSSHLFLPLYINEVSSAYITVLHSDMAHAL